MKFHIFQPRKNSQTMDVVEFNFEEPEHGGFKMPMAHCDQSILHAPGECQYCDHYPEAQALRQWWRINFTGQHDPDKAPCPSVYFRSDELRDLWGGNVPQP